MISFYNAASDSTRVSSHQQSMLYLVQLDFLALFSRAAWCFRWMTRSKVWLGPFWMHIFCTKVTPFIKELVVLGKHRYGFNLRHQRKGPPKNGCLIDVGNEIVTFHESRSFFSTMIHGNPYEPLSRMRCDKSLCNPHGSQDFMISPPVRWGFLDFTLLHRHLLLLLRLLGVPTACMCVLCIRVMVYRRSAPGVRHRTRGTARIWPGVRHRARGTARIRAGTSPPGPRNCEDSRRVLATGPELACRFGICCEYLFSNTLETGKS